MIVTIVLVHLCVPTIHTHISAEFAAAASANAKRSKLDADGQEDGLALSVK